MEAPLPLTDLSLIRKPQLGS